MADHHKIEFTTKDITDTEHPVGGSSIEGNTEIKQPPELLAAVINTQGKTEMDNQIPTKKKKKKKKNQIPTEISIQMKGWFSSIPASSHLSNPYQPPRLKPRIQMVPHFLKSIESNTKCFEPLVIALGPIHRGKSHLQRMDQVKAQYMYQFSCGCNNASYQDLYNKAESVLNEAKDCYEASALDGLTDMSFCQMMCLDGCFILQFLLMLKSDGPMKINDISHVRRDLFLLENQIPIIVLHVLMSLRTEKPRLRELLFNLQDMQPLPRDAVQHLNLTREYIYDIIKDKKPVHLLDIARSLSLQWYFYNLSEKTSTEWLSYRSVKELKTAGISFRKARGPHFSVSFKSNWLSPGTLYLPPLDVDYYTKSMLLNMAAYEACPDAPSDFEVTSYICFLDQLVDHADDVKILRSEGILFNQIGSDQLVADLFNEIANSLVPNPVIYSEVRRQIENHYKKKVYVWIAHWIHKYLYTPWSLFGLFTALIIIMLTTTQTWFTVFPRHK